MPIQLIAPGVVVKGAAGGNNAGQLLVRGTLLADGEPGNPIVFTSGDGSPNDGDWYGMRMLPAASGGVLKNVVIEYGRFGLHMDSVATEDLVTFGTELALNFNLMSQWTSFVAVDASEIVDEPGRDAHAERLTEPRDHQGIQAHLLA